LRLSITDQGARLADQLPLDPTASLSLSAGLSCTQSIIDLPITVIIDVVTALRYRLPWIYRTEDLSVGSTLSDPLSLTGP